jgi:hypothetical protein
MSRPWASSSLPAGRCWLVPSPEVCASPLGTGLLVLVVGTPLAPQQLPVEADGSRIDETKLEGVTELGDIDPGGSGTLTMSLQPGHYVLFCNEPGHFTAGMRAELTVTR